ncbi:unnamed protein product, partial [Amoebophrya sp. A25]|eukprot:GSA25T00006679001.1
MYGISNVTVTESKQSTEEDQNLAFKAPTDPDATATTAETLSEEIKFYISGVCDYGIEFASNYTEYLAIMEQWAVIRNYTEHNNTNTLY